MPERRSTGLLVLARWIVVGVVLVLVIMRVSGWNPLARTREVTGAGPDVGAVAPNFSIETVGGGRFTLAEQRGKPVILYFMAAWCPSCAQEAQALARLARQYQARGLQVLAVDVESTETAADLARFQRLVPSADYAWAIDKQGVLVQLFRVRMLDTTIVIDRQGQIVYRDEVPTDEATLRQALERTL